MRIKRLQKPIGFITVFCIFSFGLYRFNFPFGVRTCALPCTVSALVTYAVGHDGWFPKGRPSSYQDLEQLVPSYLNAETLAGISGNQRAAKSILQEHRALTADVSSWIYFPGFRRDDPPDAAVIWERAAGVSFNGKRTKPGAHVVGFVDGTWREISGSEWPSFLAKQNALRHEIIDGRRKP